MPRLLSNKSPNKITSVKVEKSEEHKQTNIKNKSLRPEENMSAWEYYNHLMKYGKRKMTRIEWVIWKMKKDEEDMEKKGYIERAPTKVRMSSKEYFGRLKYDPDFTGAEEEGFGLQPRKTWFLNRNEIND